MSFSDNFSWHYVEKENEGMTRDAYTQSNMLHCLSSSNPSTTLTPSIIDISTNEDSINSDDNKRKSEEEVSGGIFFSFLK
jgi:hypothetical protein